MVVGESGLGKEIYFYLFKNLVLSKILVHKLE